MWGAAGGLGLTQVFLHCRFFPGLPDYPATAEMFVSRRHHLLVIYAVRHTFLIRTILSKINVTS